MCLSELSLSQNFLNSQWGKSLHGDPQARAGWMIHAGGHWIWQTNGLLVKSSGSEWSSIVWQEGTPGFLGDLRNIIIEVTVQGRAEAAGISFGEYKDFLANLEPAVGHRHLQLEINRIAGWWAFRVDGEVQQRFWWDSDVRKPIDLLNGILTLKARNVEQILFKELRLHLFDDPCQLSIIITCHRFAQRLRVCLRNWCHQYLPTGTHEILVVNPNSPDGLHGYLAAMTNSYHHVRLREVRVSSEFSSNKGMMINQGFKASHGEWVWLTDADCLFSPSVAATTLEQIQGQVNCLFYGRRYHLPEKLSKALIAGRIDGLHDYDHLLQRLSSRVYEQFPWGYTQIIHRSTLKNAPYNDQHDYAGSDELFIKDCERNRIYPKLINQLYCLHLDHPFSWYGTSSYL